MNPKSYERMSNSALETAIRVSRVHEKLKLPMSKKDQDYVKRCDGEFTFDEYEKGHAYAKALEAITFALTNQGTWFSYSEKGYKAEAIPTNRYDDYRSRIDGANIMHVDQSKSPYASGDFAFGYDITITSKKDIILDKILVGSNNTEPNYPVGFSDLQYTGNQSTLKPRTPIPRYCLGIDTQSTEDIIDNISLESGNITIARPHRTAYFKFLYEIITQNDVFKHPYDQIIDNESRELTEEEQKYYHQLESMDTFIFQEIHRVVKLLPKEITDGINDSDIDQIAERLKNGTTNFSGDKTFANICEQATKIYNILEDSDDSADTLQRLRNDVRAATRKKKGISR